MNANMLEKVLTEVEEVVVDIPAQSLANLGLVHRNWHSNLGTEQRCFFSTTPHPVKDFVQTPNKSVVCETITSESHLSYRILKPLTDHNGKTSSSTWTTSAPPRASCLFPILKEIAQKPLIPLIMGCLPSLVQ